MAKRGLAYLKEQYLWGPGSQVVELIWWAIFRIGHREFS